MSNCGRPSRAVFVAALPVLIIAGAAAVASKQPAARTPPEKQTNVELRSLEPGAAIERTIDRGQEHTYRVALEAGQFMRLLIDPKGVALTVVVSAPDNPSTPAVTTPRIPSGEQRSVSWVADTTGEYRLSARALDANPPSGSYQLRLEVREPTAADRQRVTGEALVREATPLTQQGATADRAIERLEQALPVWRDLRDRHSEAETVELGRFHAARRMEMRGVRRTWAGCLSVPATRARSGR